VSQELLDVEKELHELETSLSLPSSSVSTAEKGSGESQARGDANVGQVENASGNTNETETNSPIDATSDSVPKERASSNFTTGTMGASGNDMEGQLIRKRKESKRMKTLFNFVATVLDFFSLVDLQGKKTSILNFEKFLEAVEREIEELLMMEAQADNVEQMIESMNGTICSLLITVGSLFVIYYFLRFCAWIVTNWRRFSPGAV
jgi:hypothetical protein